MEVEEIFWYSVGFCCAAGNDGGGGWNGGSRLLFVILVVVTVHSSLPMILLVTSCSSSSLSGLSGSDLHDSYSRSPGCFDAESRCVGDP